MFEVVIESQGGEIRDRRQCQSLNEALNEFGHAAIHVRDGEVLKIVQQGQTTVVAVKKA